MVPVNDAGIMSRPMQKSAGLTYSVKRMYARLVNIGETTGDHHLRTDIGRLERACFAINHQREILSVYLRSCCCQ